MASIGPGILVMLADTDAGNVVTAAQSGAKWGYRLLPLLLGLIPVLYMVQELAVRLGIFTGRGYSELVRHHYGSGWAWVLAAALVVAVAGSMVTEFAAVAGVGELYGASRNLTLPMAAGTLLVIILSGSYRRVERTAILIGALELAFLMVAVMTRPDLATIAHQVSDLPLGDSGFWLLAAALIGAVFNPWMVFYQQLPAIRHGRKAARPPALRRGAQRYRHRSGADAGGQRLGPVRCSRDSRERRCGRLAGQRRPDQ